MTYEYQMMRAMVSFNFPMKHVYNSYLRVDGSLAIRVRRSMQVTAGQAFSTRKAAVADPSVGIFHCERFPKRRAFTGKFCKSTVSRCMLPIRRRSFFLSSITAGGGEDVPLTKRKPYVRSEATSW
jgi:hypothetical protein